MSQPAAKLGDKVIATDTHIVLVPSASGAVPTPTQCPFTGVISNGCVATVLIGGQPAAVAGSVAVNLPPHVPTGGTFQTPPANQGQILLGSATVLIGGKPAARNGDKVLTCNDPAPLPIGTIIATGTVLIGG